ncbi:MAG TPA: glycosyltransferase [Syntrophobacteraceae bacterium]|nr:glycosyltransferase [Syntrophobacteraceae bacterium]
MSSPLSDPFDFTVLIPLYNEESSLIPSVHRLLEFFVRHGLRGRIILGSNGSTDHTVLVGELLEDSYPEIVRFFHTETRGAVGDVFRKAVDLASSPILISMDIDLSVDVDFILESLALLESHEIVLGSKQSGYQLRSVWRRLGSGVFLLCARLLLQLPYNDYSLGAKAYRLDSIRPWLDRLSADTNYVLDLVYQCHHARMPIVLLPVACVDWRKSRFSLIREAIVRFSHLFDLWFRHHLHRNRNSPGGCS